MYEIFEQWPDATLIMFKSKIILQISFYFVTTFKMSFFFQFFQQNEELRRQLTAQQKLIEKHKENLQKCLNVNKNLLIDKVSITF